LPKEKTVPDGFAVRRPPDVSSRSDKFLFRGLTSHIRECFLAPYHGFASAGGLFGGAKGKSGLGHRRQRGSAGKRRPPPRFSAPRLCPYRVCRSGLRRSGLT